MIAFIQYVAYEDLAYIADVAVIELIMRQAARTGATRSAIWE